jgi:uncharacterized coiled-coil protein SlyX
LKALPALILAAVLGAAPAAADPPAIKFEQAEEHVGEEVTVDGRVLGVHCSQLSCVLAFDPTFNRLTAVIRSKNFESFPPGDLDRLYSGRRVRVHGKIQTSDGKPQIVVETADDLVLVHAERRQQRDAERALKTQAEVLDRLGDVLDQVTELTERMAQTQERMDALLAQMEQREVALANALAAAQPPPAPPPPSGGEPQPRPAFEALRTIKRGMSRNEVQRLVGQPTYVEPSGNGWVTWYYGYGRSVSFDARGRVQSMVGFPAP